MKDYLGKELNVGDEVVFVESGYRNFKRGIIIKITSHFCYINYGSRDVDNIKQGGYQLIKIKKEDDRRI